MTDIAKMGGVHHGALTRYTTGMGRDRLEVTASLYQAHAPWLTGQYVDIEFSGLEHDWRPITATLLVAADQAVELGRFVTDLGQVAAADYAAQVQAGLSALARKTGAK